MADTMRSAEFRRRYARLAQPVVVTALGRAIGEWYPAGTGPTSVATAPSAVDIRGLLATDAIVKDGDPIREAVGLPRRSIRPQPDAVQGGSEPGGVHTPVPVGSTPTPATTQRVSADAYRAVSRRPKA